MNDQTINYLIYAGMFLGVLMLFTGLAQVFQRGETQSEARTRRLKMIEQGASTEEILALLKPERRSGGIFSRLPLIGDLGKTLLQAGMTITPNRFMLNCCLIAFVIFAVAMQFYPAWVAAMGAFIVGIVAPLLVVRHRKKQRTDALIAQLPDALDLMSRGLRVGHPLNTSIKAVAEEMADPIGTEFGIIFDQVSYGDDIVDSFQEMADRVDVEDVQYLAASIGIQHGTGGDLASIIATLGRVIRGRITMRIKIRAISAEGRLTSIFLSLVPPAIFVFTSLTNPDYYGSVQDDPAYLPMMGIIAGLTVANYLALRRLVNFRI